MGRIVAVVAALLLVAAALAARSWQRTQPAVVSEGPLVLSPSTLRLSFREPLSAPGPRHELRIALPDSFGVVVLTGQPPVLISSSGRRIRVTVSAIDANGTSHTFGEQGFSIHGGLHLSFAADGRPFAGQTVRAIEVTASDSLSAWAILWWSGNPADRCFLCI